jgi:cell division protein FtsW
MTRSLTSSILLSVMALMGIGLVQVYSSSFIFAIESHGDGLFFFKRQLFFVGLSSIGLFCMTIIPYRWIERWGAGLWFVAVLGLILTFVPGVGVRVGGALRWLSLPGGFRFEPSELLKISYPLFLGAFVNRHGTWFDKIPKAVWMALLFGPFFLLLKQPDFGTFAILVCVGFAVLFAFGLRWKWILVGTATLTTAFYFLVMMVPYRKARILSFLDPWADPEQKGFQVIQSLLSFHSGGLTGVGLGQGQGKLFFLPEAHTDFTLAVLGEEMGFIGFGALLLIYAFIIFRCFQLAIRAEDNFSKVFALGSGLVFGLSVFINAGVIMGLLADERAHASIF